MLLFLFKNKTVLPEGEAAGSLILSTVNSMPQNLRYIYTSRVNISEGQCFCLGLPESQDNQRQSLLDYAYGQGRK